ncbi:MAG TPA: MDR family MFS transporter [Dehalococcoidia bacterium]|nr:MDR family MFS transporter [Dehalococcoidia bacterium]
MRLRLEYKWLVGIVFVFGIFMDLLDMTITNVALPTLAKDFTASTTTIQWVVTGYLLGLAVFIPVSGWAGDRFGTKRIFMFALFLFTAGSLLCGLAWSIESLIAFRVLQGVGGGMLTPVGTAMLFRAFPPAERAVASAVLSIPIVVAPASGPVLGGYLVEYQSWRWIFLINIPVGITGLLVAAAFLREEKQARPGRLDAPGLLLAGAGLACVMYALAEAGSRGLDDGRVALLGTAGLALLAVFTVVELRAAEPMIDVRLFRDKLFRAANVVQFMGYGGMLGALFLLPLLLQAEMGMGPLESGLTMFPQAIGVFMMVQPAGRLYRRIGPRRMMMAGMAGVVVTTLAFLLVDLETSQWWIRLIMLARGWSFALTLIPIQTATFATISSEDTGRASAILNAGRQVAASFGVALLATVLTNRMTHHDAVLGSPLTRDGALTAFHEAFLVAAGLGIVGIIASLLIDDKAAAGTMRQPVVLEEDEPLGVPAN